MLDFQLLKPGGCWLATWFLKIDPVWFVGMRVCVCPRPRLLITSGVIWTPYDWLTSSTAAIWQL